MSVTSAASGDYANKASDYFGTPRREMLEFVPQGVRSVLEIGCGTGAFGALVKTERQCRYTGVELVEQAASQARGRLDQVLVADVESAPLPFAKATFDCIVCNDVLEHLRDPWAVLKMLTGYLGPGGHVVASLPNVRFSEVMKDLVIRKKWEYTERGVLDRTHLRFFTESTVRELFRSAGLDVLQIRGINGIRYAWRLRLLNAMLFNALDDMRYLEIACVGRLRADAQTGAQSAG
jgi:2-polyprenyl-3-methyl-5-hydroxy-6-metoxy-1,4-benzoquinol methylase